MSKITTVLILCFAISTPVLAERLDTSDLWTKLFKFQLSIAKQGDAKAMLILGDMYRKGEGTEVNLHEALFWYKRAKREGNQKAAERIEELMNENDTQTRRKTKAAKTNAAKRKTVKKQKKIVKNKPKNKSTNELESARRKARQLEQQLARQQAEAEKARKELQRVQELKQQLAQQQAAAAKARRDLEVLKNHQVQLVLQRKAAEQAAFEAEKNAQSEAKQTALNADEPPAPKHEQESTVVDTQNSQKGTKSDINTFKSNPCDDPKIRDSYSCKLLNRRH